MDRAAALRRFVKEHLALLDNAAATSEQVKRLRQHFFDRHSLKADARFRARDVALQVAELVARRGFESAEALSALLAEIPFVNDELTDEEISLIWNAASSTKPSHLSPEDLSKIKREEHLRKIEGEIADRMAGEVNDRLRVQLEDLEARRRQFEEDQRKFGETRSQLEDWPENPDLATLLARLEPAPAAEQGETAAGPWWREAQLVADPFPSNQGLAEIPKEKYEAVVVQTSFFKYYLSAAGQAPDKLLGKTSLVLGEFGSGKTTLFQYLTATLGAKGVLPILAIINPHPNVANLTTKMLEQVRLTLAHVVAERTGQDPRREGFSADPEGDVVRLLLELQQHGSAGFVIFVDGLHKGTTYTEQVLEFLQQIQNVQELFTHQQIRVGFIVAGSPLWEQQLAVRPSLSGSFYRKDNIPPLSEDVAVEAVERRLTAYSEDPSQPVRIRRDSLRKAFQVLTTRLGRNLTFRDFLDHVRLRLEAREYDEMGLVVRLHFEDVEIVHRMLKSSAIASKVEQLFAGVRSDRRLMHVTRDVMLQTLSKAAIPERGDFFHARQAGFFLLYKAGLLGKRKRDDGALAWSIAPDVLTVLASISQRTKIPPDDVIRAIFERPEQLQNVEQRTVLTPVEELLEANALAWKDSWEEVSRLLETARAGFLAIDQAYKDGYAKVGRPLLTKPLEHLVDAFNWFTHNAVDEEKRWTLFAESWCAPEDHEEVARFIKDPSPIKDKTAFFGLLHEVSRIAGSLIEDLEGLVRGEGLVRLRGRTLAREEFLFLHEMRGMYQQQGYREVAERLASEVEDRIRGTLYHWLCALWGNEARKRLPPDIRARLDSNEPRGHPGARREHDQNFLYDVNRSEYTKIAFDGTIHKQYLGTVVEQHQKAEFKDRLELLFSLNDRTAHRDRPAYFREHATEIADVLRFMPRFLETFHAFNRYALKDAKFEMEAPHDGTVIGHFCPSATPSTVGIRISKKDATAITKALLTAFSVRPIQLDTLERLLVAGSVAPEIQLAMMRVNMVMGYLTVKPEPFAPNVVHLTEKGRQHLAKFSASGSQAALPTE